jgi:hypothetical protein
MESWVAYILCGVVVGQFGMVVALLYNMPFRYVLRRDYEQNRTEMLDKFKELFDKIDKLYMKKCDEI